MRFTHIDINFGVKYEGNQNCSKTLSMYILRGFGHHHMWCQNWRQYVWTSLCQFIFFVNLLHSPCVWLFDIWHLFDKLTSFWQLDIFLTTWHLFWYVQQDTWAMGHMGKGVSCVILKIEMVYLVGWGTWVMGHMGNRAHDYNVGKWVSWLILKIEMGHLGRWGTWVMGHMVNVVMCLIMCNFLNTAWIFTKILLDIDIDVFYLNIHWYCHDGLFKYKKIEGFEILIGSNIGSMNLFH